jgi:general secretion pathway protein K
MKMPVQRNTQGASQGFILVAVLWILSALAAMASIYGTYVARTAVAVAVNDDVLMVEGMVSAAVELTAYRLIEEPVQSRPTRGSFSFRLGAAHVVVEFCSDAARIDLNEAPREVLAGLFAVVGAAPNDATQYADRIVGWRTAPRANTQDAEAAIYRAAGLNYGPRGAPFEHVGELSLVLGVPPAMVERILPFVTVFSGSQQVNLRDAAPEVVAAVAAVTSERPSDRLANRGRPEPGPAASPGTPTAGPSRALVEREPNAAMRIVAHMAFDNGRRRAAEVVVLVDDGADEPYRVLSWQDDTNPMTNVGISGGVLP